MYNFAIGSLAIISSGKPTGDILLQTPIQGLEAPDQRMNVISKPGRDGGTISSQFYDPRNISLIGKIESSTPANFESARRQLIAAVGISRDSTQYPLPVRVSFTTLGGTNYFVDCLFKKPVLDYTSPVDGDFLITGVAPNPMIFGASQQISSAISPPAGGGYVVPMITPYTSAGSTGGSTVINNAGSETAWPIITLTGPLSNPVLTNTTTGAYLQLSYNLASGDKVIVNMDAHTITLNGASLVATKTATSDWWGLAPGNNNVTVTTTNSSNTGTAVVAYYYPYTGV